MCADICVDTNILFAPILIKWADFKLNLSGLAISDTFERPCEQKHDELKVLLHGLTVWSEIQNLF